MSININSETSFTKEQVDALIDIERNKKDAGEIKGNGLVTLAVVMVWLGCFFMPFFTIAGMIIGFCNMDLPRGRIAAWTGVILLSAGTVFLVLICMAGTVASAAGAS